jgi:hypothetical protein
MQPQPPRPNRYVFDDACPQDSAHDSTMARIHPTAKYFHTRTSAQLQSSVRMCTQAPPR